MKVTVKDINIYYICPDRFVEQAKIIQTTCNELNAATTTRISFNDTGTKPNLVSRAHIATCDKIMEDNMFPVLILEDDAKLIKPFPEYINLPDNCDMMYLGGSVYRPGTIPNMYVENYDDDNYRIYYCLSTHALLFPSLESIIKYKDICQFALHTYHDVELGRRSVHNLYLTPKNGMYFYQTGINQGVTKFEWYTHQGLVKK